MESERYKICTFRTLFKPTSLTVGLDDQMALPIDERAILIVGLTVIVIIVVMVVRVKMGKSPINTL
jgi:hypothetical protein